MKIKTLRKFRDLKEKKLREIGDEFEVSKERFKEINSTKYGVLVEEIVKEVEDETKEKTNEKAKNEKKK